MSGITTSQHFHDLALPIVASARAAVNAFFCSPSTTKAELQAQRLELALQEQPFGSLLVTTRAGAKTPLPLYSTLLSSVA